MNTEEQIRRGIHYFGSGQLDAAIADLEAVLKAFPNIPIALHFLGLAYHRKGQSQAGLELLLRSVQAAPSVPPFYNNLGLVFSDLRDFDRSAEALRKAIELDPNSAQGHDNLGTVLQKKGVLEEAAQCHRTALEKDPSLVSAANNLATALAGLSKTAEAIDLLEQKITEQPGIPELQLNLGKLYRSVGRHDEAIKRFNQVLELRPNNIEAIIGLAQTLDSKGEFELAVQHLRRALQIQPHHARALLELGNILRAHGDVEEALACYQRSVEADPNYFPGRWNACLALPILYKDESEIDRFRDHWSRGVLSLLEFLENPAPTVELPIVPPHPNFYLHYQQRNDLAAQVQFGRIVTQLSGRAYPHLDDVRKPKRQRTKPRIGFASHFFNLHTVFKLFHGWIKHLDRTQFESHCFFLGKDSDKATNFIENHSDHFYHGFSGHTSIVHAIQKADLDVLIYPELGMDPLALSLAALRLAPVQCMSWGHPVTSGLPTIDYFLSSDLMEPVDGEQHYSEKLVRLPNLSICYPRPDISQAEPPESARNKNKPAFLCLQSLFKLLPQFDCIYPRIALNYPECEFWFIGLESFKITELFQTRLAKAFEKFGLNASKYVRVFPKCRYGNFLGLIQSSDVILDSIGWSGGNTTLEAVAFGKPIVTLPGTLMRSRHTYAILKQLGVKETIANDLDDYVRIAVRLVSEPATRDRIASHMSYRQTALYNDLAAVRGLEAFLKRTGPGF